MQIDCAQPNPRVTHTISTQGPKKGTFRCSVAINIGGGVKTPPKGVFFDKNPPLGGFLGIKGGKSTEVGKKEVQR